MMRALYSGVSGLKVHQTKMDVIGNNISNVNTIGFKSSNAIFSDILYQNTSSATGPNAERGTAGINAKQIGLGASLAAISVAMDVTGGSQRTDNGLDLMIEGDGFFIVNNGTQNFFTKAGAFTTDAAGNLCNVGGALVMGWQVDPNNPTKCVADTVSPLRVMKPENLYIEPEGTTNMFFSGNIDYKDSQLTSDTGKIATLPFYDNLGHAYMAVVKLKQSAEGTNQYKVSVTNILDANGDSIFVKKTVEDDGTITYSPNDATSQIIWGSEGETIDVGEVNEETGEVTMGQEEGAGVDLVFDPTTGSFLQVGTEEGQKSISFQVVSDPSPFGVIDVDFSAMTMYKASGSSKIKAEWGDRVNGNGKGCQAGNMTGLSVDTSGKIYGQYDNGDSKLLGQIAVTTFANAAGLEALGNNMFGETMNSGKFDGIGEEVTLGGGKMNSGVLEMSNVDLSNQFTDMITTQRGFQANSRIITTSDTLLEELINLKR